MYFLDHCKFHRLTNSAIIIEFARKDNCTQQEILKILINQGHRGKKNDLKIYLRTRNYQSPIQSLSLINSIIGGTTICKTNRNPETN